MKASLRSLLEGDGPKYLLWCPNTYPLVNKRGNEISPFFVENTSSKGPFFIAMLVYGSVDEKFKSTF